MNTLDKLKEPAGRLITGLLVSIQAVIGVPFLLTMVGNIRHWNGWFHPKD